MNMPTVMEATFFATIPYLASYPDCIMTYENRTIVWRHDSEYIAIGHTGYTTENGEELEYAISESPNSTNTHSLYHCRISPHSSALCTFNNEIRLSLDDAKRTCERHFQSKALGY